MTAGKPLDQTYKNENVELVQKGCCNLVKCALLCLSSPAACSFRLLANPAIDGLRNTVLQHAFEC